MFVTFLILALTTYAGLTALAIHTNYTKARSLKLPIIIAPVTLFNPLWAALYRFYPDLIYLVARLPYNLGRFASVTYLGWQYDDKHAIHARLGPAFVVVTPGKNELHLADPTAVQYILGRRKEFAKPRLVYGPLEFFGENLDSAPEEIWPRHRKITAPSFNERISGVVWKEAIRQATQLLQKWEGLKDGTRAVAESATLLTLNVFSYAGYGIKYDIPDGDESKKEQLSPPHRMGYRDALSTVIDNYIFCVIFPKWLLYQPWMPGLAGRTARACKEFQLYMEEMVHAEKTNPSIPTTASSAMQANNVLQALIAAAETSEPSGTSSATAKGMTDRDLYGNLFIYTMAGHETTANAVTTAIAYLSTEPSVQDWLASELQTHLPSLPADATTTTTPWDYSTAFPKLVRTQAVMLETLRLHGSVVFLPKIVETGTPQVVPLSTEGKELVIPPDTFVFINIQALHCDPAVWGPDVLEWKPARWITRDKKEGAEEKLITPRPGSFVPWADGPRICPGQKFSLVEFVAVIATLFRYHTVTPDVDWTDTEGARKATKEMIENSGIGSFTLQMRDPRRVRMAWKARS